MHNDFQKTLALAIRSFQAGNAEEADRFASEALAANPKSVDALHLRGVLAGVRNRHADAEFFLRQAVDLDKKNHYIFFNLAKSLSEQGKAEESLEWHRKALEVDARHDKAWLNYGKSLFDLDDIDAAISAYDRALLINHNFAEVYTNKASCLDSKKLWEEALLLHEHAVRLNPNLAEAWSNRGFTLNDLKRHEEALASYERAIELKPDIDFILGTSVHTQMKLCDWTELEPRRRALNEGLAAGNRVGTPFAILGLFDNPELQKRCAEIYAKDIPGPKSRLGVLARKPKRGKLRIGYFSMDFREHAVSQLIAELFELHDRSKFEIYGFSFGVNSRDPVRQRVEKAFDKFLDVKHLRGLDIAHLSRQHEIDIAIDLGGHTQDSRPQIFVGRAAPIQINYLGFPGTWGSDCMDYFIGDKVVIPDENREHFSEKIIFLPNSFQVNPSHRSIAINKLSRQAHGLPDGAFVFCCFHNSWKITPEVFRQWVRILQQVSNSVLWLSEINSSADKNLRKNLEQNGIDRSRLIFAKRLPELSDHLARYQLADLFLDTSPYGAHTTASDSLWVELPVLTCIGQSFAARVAASLLTSIGVPELITHSKEEYCSLAIELASNPTKLAAIKAKLAQNRFTTPLFNTKLFTMHIESAYQAAYERYSVGLPPDHIYIGH
jgi:predicted O-linked N-acetylglucosamine transferase (SPINDLY family)